MPSQEEGRSKKISEIFDDYEARTNFVGFFDLLYKIDRRLEPERYEGAEVAGEQLSSVALGQPVSVAPVQPYSVGSRQPIP